MNLKNIVKYETPRHKMSHIVQFHYMKYSLIFISYSYSIFIFIDKSIVTERKLVVVMGSDQLLSGYTYYCGVMKMF